MKHVVIGLGEVGQALVKVFKCDGEDKFKDILATEKHYDMLHIAFPYSKSFIEQVENYKTKFSPKYIVIHSTVPIGTSKKCGATHSPIRGVHPHLADSIQTFKKFVGGADAFLVATEFKKFRIPTMCVLNSDNTEAGKIWDTTQYGVMIMLNKEIYNYCEKNVLDFNIVYSLFNETYNEGFTKMFRPEVMRPYLEYRNEPIGGHCVIGNAKLLDSPSAKHILKLNEELIRNTGN